MTNTKVLPVLDIVLPWSFINDDSKYNCSSYGWLTLPLVIGDKNQTKSSKYRPASTIGFTIFPQGV
jgi:hypothetical protein